MSLHKQNLNAGSRLADKLLGKQIALSAVSNTPLAALVTESMPVFQEKGTTADPLTSLMMAVAQKDALGVEGHELAMEEIISVVVPGVIKQIQFARNVVKESINKVHGAVTLAVENSKPSNMEVRPLYLHSALSSQFTEQLYSDFKQVSPRELTKLEGMKQLSTEELNNLLTTGAVSYDQDLVDLVAKHGDNWVSDVYGKYIAGNSLAGTIPSRDYRVADELLIAVLLTQKLRESEPLTESMSLVSYRAALALNMQTLAICLYHALNSYWRMVESKVLVVSVPNIPSYVTDNSIVIHVVGPVMEEYLSDGGTPEAVFGAAIDPKALLTKQYVLDNRVTLQQRYESWWATALATHGKQLASVLRNELEQALCAEFLRLPEEQVITGYSRTEVVTEIKRCVAESTDAEVTGNLYGTIQKILGLTAFQSSSAVKLLKSMDQYEKKFPDIDARTAAYMAVRDSVVDWALSMVEVGRQ